MELVFDQKKAKQTKIYRPKWIIRSIENAHQSWMLSKIWAGARHSLEHKAANKRSK